MRIVTLIVSSREKASQRFLRASEGESQGAFISFESPELLFGLLTSRRWDLLRIMTGAGSITIQEAAQRLQKDVTVICDDVHALLNAGILHKTDKDRIEFPFEAIHVDFMLKAA